jgi:hypothetical protein
MGSYSAQRRADIPDSCNAGRRYPPQPGAAARYGPRTRHVTGAIVLEELRKFLHGTTLSSGVGLGAIPTTFTIQGTNAD